MQPIVKDFTGTDTQTVALSERNPQWHNQISIQHVGGTQQGTITVRVRPREQLRFEALNNAVVDLTAPSAVVFNGYVVELELVPTGLADDTEYRVVYYGGMQ